jgi:uncharacterized protein (DUF1330 family)
MVCREAVARDGYPNRGSTSMKVRWATTFGTVIGLALGVIGGFALAAPTRSVYVVIELDQITDAATYDVLKKSMGMRAVVQTQMANGRYLARTEDVTALDGTPPKTIVIIAFDSEAKAKAYYENTKEITAMRLKAANSRAFIVGVCSEFGKLSSSC